MHQLIQFGLLVILYVLVRSGDSAIGAIIARDYLRIVAYGLVALLALIYVLLALFLH